MDYKELLKDGRWQVKRAKIMQRDNFTCRICGKQAADGTTLNVHHIQYRRGAKPWEYDDNELVTLCEYCHKKEHDDIKSVIYDLKIGDFITYYHSDFKNSGVIYDINWDKMQAKLASIDDGSDYSMLWLERIQIKPNGDFELCNGWGAHREKHIILDDFFDEDEHEIPSDGSHYHNFFMCVAECLLHIREYYESNDTDHFEILDRDLDASEELTTLYKNLDKILENNRELYEYFRRYNAL